MAAALVSASFFASCEKPDSQNQSKDYLVGKWGTTGAPNRLAGVNYELTLTIDNKYYLKEIYFNDMIDTTTVGCNRNRVETHHGTYELKGDNTMVLDGKYSTHDFVSYAPNCANRTDFDTTFVVKGDHEFLYINKVNNTGTGMALKRIP